MSELVKILIKAPQEKSRSASVYPLICWLNQQYPNSQIHILVNEGQELIYSMFTFPVKIYEFNQRQKSLPQIHRYAVNFHQIFNIDIFFDLGEGFKSSFVGFSFKAKNRIGYVDGLNKWLLTHRVNTYNGISEDKKYIKLFESYSGEYFSEYGICGITKREELKASSEEEHVNLPDYFFIHSTDILVNQIFWQNFFRFFENQYFVIWYDPKLSEEQYDELSKFFKGLEQQNIYMLKTGEEKTFLKFLVHAVGYLTNIIEWGHISEYLGIKTYLLLEDVTTFPVMEYFERSPVVIQLTDGVPTKWIADEDVGPVETVDRLVNLLHDIHEL